MNTIKKVSFLKKMKFWIIIVMGIFCGVVLFLIYVSKAPSYLTNAPETCMNCHIMAPQYSSWFHSSHKNFTNCNECHIPQDNIIRSYFFKAKDGLRHATVFTLRKEPQVIRIKSEGKEVVRENCLLCHSGLYENRYLNNIHQNILVKEQRNMDCMFCHRETAHSIISSLSSVPNARVPLPKSAVPSWLKKIIN